MCQRNAEIGKYLQIFGSQRMASTIVDELWKINVLYIQPAKLYFYGILFGDV